MREHHRLTRNRREFIRDAFCGFGSLAMTSMLHQEYLRAASANPLAPKLPHLPVAKAKSVIFLFMAGGPSHIETFDPKPLLNELNGQTRPKEFGEAKYQFVTADAKLLGCKRTFKKYGQSGIEVSDLFPETAQLIDDIAVLRGCHGDMVVHSAAQYELFSGRVVPGFPSMGSWTIYGLGSESESLPAYVQLANCSARRGEYEKAQAVLKQAKVNIAYLDMDETEFQRLTFFKREEWSESLDKQIAARNQDDAQAPADEGDLPNRSVP